MVTETESRGGEAALRDSTAGGRSQATSIRPLLSPWADKVTSKDTPWMDTATLRDKRWLGKATPKDISLTTPGTGRIISKHPGRTGGPYTASSSSHQPHLPPGYPLLILLHTDRRAEIKGTATLGQLYHNPALIMVNPLP